MRICGKTLPPRAALLLSTEFVSFTVVIPILFMVPVLTGAHTKTASSIAMSLIRLMIAGLACQAIFYYHELYNLQVIRLKGEAMLRVMKASAMLLLVLALVSLIFPHLTPVLSRVLWFGALSGPVAVLSRMLVLPRRRERVLVIGRGEEAAQISETILSCPEWNMEVVEIVSAQDDLTPWLAEAMPHASFDRVIVTDPRTQRPDALQLLLRLKMAGLPIEEGQTFFERATGQVRVDGLTADQCIFSNHFNNGLTKRKVKRLFDLFAASVLIAITLPWMLAVAAAVWSRRDGPVLFVQTRNGLYGKPFQIYKFRTMTNIPAQEKARWAAQETHRITRLGAFLRKYRLDELPQLFNILRGEMSLVGPRPEQPALCSLLREQVPFFDQRHTVPPGLTGWAQVKFGYGSTIAESKRKVEFDLFYVKHLSLWLDCAVLLETVKVVLVGRGAL